AELHDERKHLQLRRGNPIELRQAVLVVPSACLRAADAVPDTTPVRAEVTHDAEAPNASTRIATEIDHEVLAIEFRDRPADVARDVNPEHTGKHADSHVAHARIELARAHHLIRHDDRPLLLA